MTERERLVDFSTNRPLQVRNRNKKKGKEKKMKIEQNWRNGYNEKEIVYEFEMLTSLLEFGRNINSPVLSDSRPVSPRYLRPCQIVDPQHKRR